MIILKKEQKAETSAVSEKELELINSYARRQLSADEVYVFSVVLCDNEVDRDFERFTVDSLKKLGELFVGKTGIFDHNPTAKNQSARIISTEVEEISGKKNSLGENYFRLKASAYMPKSEGNLELRDAIDSGIVREVSVGCSVGKTLCSICGSELSSCSHIKGERYSGKLCCGELVNPTDAYEFSFVAVPAQKDAGVIKSFGKEKSMEEILKSIENGEAVSLTKTDSEHLKTYLGGLKKQAADGAFYRTRLESDVLKYSAIVQPEVSDHTMKCVVRSLGVEELCELKEIYKARAGKKLPRTPQLAPQNITSAENNNSQFRI